MNDKILNEILEVLKEIRTDIRGVRLNTRSQNATPVATGYRQPLTKAQIEKAREDLNS